MRNEYLDRFSALDVDYRSEWWESRRELVMEYAWAVPTDEALDALADLGPLVEIGAGGGYWAALLRARGVDVVAYDERPVGGERENANENANASRSWSEVRQGNSASARLHPDRTLFLCWPPYATPMAFSALYGYLERGGQTLALVGEKRGGCTGNDDFFDLLDERMEETGHVSIPTWAGIHDYLSIYTRKE